MSKVKFGLLITAMSLMLACATSRSARNPDGRLLPPSSAAARAEDFFQRGKLSMEKGDMVAAKSSFNQALDVLLDASANGPGIENKSILNDYIQRIADIELNYLKDKNSPENDQHEAFLDQVIATPLFLPSEKDILDLKQKVSESAAISYGIPVIVNSQVVSFLKAFQTIRHDGIQRALERMGEFIGPFQEIFRRNEIPEDLAFLPIIESGFRVDATSRAKARGAWQFMASTARMYGLRVDWLVDERLDPFKAADAAARFLKDLYVEFNDWYIALACYNGGSRRIKQAMRVHQASDFFTITQGRHIRNETKNYVPAFLASLIIARSPGDYGFTLNGNEAIFAGCKTVTVPSPVSLSRIADLLQIPYADLKKMNPELLRDITPNHVSEYTLRVADDADETLLAGLERVPPQKIPKFNSYRVHPGDTISSIARRHATSVSQIMRANNLKSNLIRPGMNLIIPRGNG
jgi:membrane-bound lytic murein transglycosylase D